METVTLHAQDFKTVHNTLCQLRSLAQDMNHRMVKVEEVEQIVAQFEQGLANAYEQDLEQFDSKMDYFTEFKTENGFRAIWSLFELPVNCFDQPHPFSSDAFVVYRDHWGEGAKDKHYPVLGSTWGDVYRAADLAVRESGDGHHIFIEGFDVHGNELRMFTGS